MSPGEDVLEAPPPPRLPCSPPAGDAVPPDKLQPCCELSSQTSEEPAGSVSSPQPPAPAQPGGEEEEGPPSEDPGVRMPTTDTNPQLASEQEERSTSPTDHKCVAGPGVTFDLEVAEVTSDDPAGRPEGPSSPAGGDEGSAATAVPPVEEGQACPGAGGDTPESPDTADNQTLSPRVSDPGVSRTSHVSGTEDPPLDPLNSSREAPELQAEPDISRNLMSSAVFLGGIVSLSIVLQEPSTLFFIGLLLVLRRL